MTTIVSEKSMFYMFPIQKHKGPNIDLAVNRSRSTQDHHLNKTGKSRVPSAAHQLSRPRLFVSLFSERVEPCRNTSVLVNHSETILLFCYNLFSPWLESVVDNLQQDLTRMADQETPNTKRKPPTIFNIFLERIMCEALDDNEGRGQRRKTDYF